MTQEEREHAVRVLRDIKNREYEQIETDENLHKALQTALTVLREPKPDSVTITLPDNGLCAIVRKVDGHYEIDTGRVEKWPEDEK